MCNQIFSVDTQVNSHNFFAIIRCYCNGLPPVDVTLRKILKHQTEVDNNHEDWYQFNFSTIICIEINRGDFFFMTYWYIFGFRFHAYERGFIGI